jgi:hypothetical protein
MQDLWREFEAGRMNEQQAFWFKNRPAEELYDIINDPEEVNNLAGNPKYKKQLNTMRQALEEWQVHITDLSDRPEIDLAKQFWPNGKQPVTAQPSIYIDESGYLAIKGNTVGSSLGFQINYKAKQSNKEKKKHLNQWQVYNQPIKIEKGMKISAKAVRYGYTASDVVTRTF